MKKEGRCHMQGKGNVVLDTMFFNVVLIHSMIRVRDTRRKGKDKRRPVKDKDWVNHKKELNRMRGREGVPHDSKYTARKRKVQF